MNANLNEQSTTCPDCGLVVFSTAETMCPRCGAMLSGEEPDYKLKPVFDCESSLDEKYERIGEAVIYGEKLDMELDDFVNEVQRDADDGDDEAQDFLARRVYDENTDPEIVFRLRTAAAKQGNHRAELDLGIMYEHGIGVGKDVFAAIRLYRKSARHGNVQALIKLGTLFSNGSGVKQDRTKAIACFEKCLAVGYIPSAVCLGIVYLEGENTPENNEKALHYLRMGAEKGDNFARFEIYRMFKDGRTCSLDAVEALTWCRMAAEGENGEALRELGLRSVLGDGVEKDIDAGVEMLERAGDLGVARAWRELGRMFYNGEPYLPKDDCRSYEYTVRAADAGDDEAIHDLILKYYDGVGCPQDKARAYELAKEAVASGCAAALGPLGHIEWQNGNYAKARECYLRGAEKGYGDAAMALAWMYWQGDQVEPDLALARKYAEVAVRAKHGDAERMLADIERDAGLAASSAESVQ